jgi:uncharacterized membrane protein YgcG
MLAADKLLLQSNLKQRTIQLREKELNLFNSNITAVGTQSTVLAGFTITCLIEITLPNKPHVIVTTMLHLFAVASICANLLCVVLATMVSVWGSSVALRGKDGSMGRAVDHMNAERFKIFGAFGVGLVCNLMAVMSAGWLLMQPFVAALATACILYTLCAIFQHGRRIHGLFRLEEDEAVSFDDLLEMGQQGLDAQRDRENDELAHRQWLRHQTEVGVGGGKGGKGGGGGGGGRGARGGGGGGYSTVRSPNV